MFRGTAASPGIAIGRVLKYFNQRIDVEGRRIEIHETEEELNKFNNAVEAHKQHLMDIREKTRKEVGEDEARIFDAHLLILEDPAFRESVEEKIKGQRCTASKAVKSAVEELIYIFKSIKDDYIKERFSDIEDVGKGVLKKILNIRDVSLGDLGDNIIIVAEELTPSDTIRMDKSKIVGFALDTGGKTSHISIMAKSLEIPAVVGVNGLSGAVSNNDMIIVDGDKGVVLINPSEDQLEYYSEKLRDYQNQRLELKKIKTLPSRTADGVEIEIAANIGTPGEVNNALEHGAQGVGLYRTEFLFMNRDSFPTEEEQFEAYKKVAEKMSPGPVIIRTLDIGADKQLSYMELPKEMNPFLGWRAIRICLERKEILKTQLRAILRASVYGNLKIMYPMISRLKEVREANTVLKEVMEGLRKEKIPFDQNIQVGIMIEVPSAAIIADILIREVDFFSIGTNDLTQYMLAIDRMNEKVSKLYTPMHPSVLRIIKKVIDAAHAAGKWAGMCGEMAGDPKAAVILVGMGIDELSMNPSSILKVKRLLRQISFTDAKKLADRTLALGTTAEIEELCKAELLRLGLQQ